MFGDSRISSLLPQIVGKDCPSGPNGGGRRAFGQHFTQTELAFKHADGTFDPAAKPLQFSKPLGALVLGFTGRQPTDFGDAHSAHLKASKLKQVLRAVESSIRGNCLGPLTENLFGLADQRKQMNLIAGIAVMDFVMNDHSRVILHQLQRTTKFDRLIEFSLHDGPGMRIKERNDALGNRALPGEFAFGLFKQFFGHLDLRPKLLFELGGRCPQQLLHSLAALCQGVRSQLGYFLEHFFALDLTLFRFGLIEWVLTSDLMSWRLSSAIRASPNRWLSLINVVASGTESISERWQK